MFPYFETLACREGIILHVEAHRARCMSTLQQCVPRGQMPSWLSHPVVPEEYTKGFYRVKLQYDGFSWQVDWFPYQRQHHTGLTFYEIGSFEYPHKRTDRTYFENCLRTSGQEVWLHRNGVLLDTTYSHVALWMQDGWVTPAAWLLPSTKRQVLVDQKLVKESPLNLTDIPRNGYLILYNALRDWEDLYSFESTQSGLILQLETDEKIGMELRRFPK